MHEQTRRVVIITGATKGIGKQYAWHLARTGWNVAITGRAAVDAVEKEFSDAGVEVFGAVVDAADAEATADFVATVNQRFGRIDAVVNNAAYFSEVPHVPVDEVDPQVWDEVFRVNTGGILNTTRAVVPLFRSRGSGVIVNISSSTVFLGTPEFLPYVGSKAAIIGITRALARELGQYGVRVNTLTPGFTLTAPVTDDFTAGLAGYFRERRSLARDATPRDLLGALDFLLSEASAFVTGQNLVVDGGDVLN